MCVYIQISRKFIFLLSLQITTRRKNRKLRLQIPWKIGIIWICCAYECVCALLLAHRKRLGKKSSSWRRILSVHKWCGKTSVCVWQWWIYWNWTNSKNMWTEHVGNVRYNNACTCTHCCRCCFCCWWWVGGCFYYLLFFHFSLVCLAVYTFPSMKCCR